MNSDKQENKEVEHMLKPILIEDLGMIYTTEFSKKMERFGLYSCPFCGNIFKVRISSVEGGHTKSCGCYHKIKAKECNTKHGEYLTKLYKVWSAMKFRVTNPTANAYELYGGKGITICEEWLDYLTFRDWALLNGYGEDKGLSIDRIDSNGNYEPNNCRIADRTTQARNQGLSKNNTTGYKGVSYHKARKKYHAHVKIDYKAVHLGYFKTAVEGAIAYNIYIIENNLEGFVLNKIPEEFKDIIPNRAVRLKNNLNIIPNQEES